MTTKFSIGEQVYCRGFVCEVMDWDITSLGAMYRLEKVNFTNSPIMINWVHEYEVKHYPLIDVEIDFE